MRRIILEVCLRQQKRAELMDLPEFPKPLVSCQFFKYGNLYFFHIWIVFFWRYQLYLANFQIWQSVFLSHLNCIFSGGNKCIFSPLYEMYFFHFFWEYHPSGNNSWWTWRNFQSHLYLPIFKCSNLYFIYFWIVLECQSSNMALHTDAVLAILVKQTTPTSNIQQQWKHPGRTELMVYQHAQKWHGQTLPLWLAFPEIWERLAKGTQFKPTENKDAKGSGLL